MDETCEWIESNYGYYVNYGHYVLGESCNRWDTSCGNSFVFEDGTPSENGFRNCPYCGRKLIEKVEQEE